MPTDVNILSSVPLEVIFPLSFQANFDFLIQLLIYSIGFNAFLVFFVFFWMFYSKFIK